MNLSKSRYTRGTQCPKMLWMEAHRPELYDASIMNQAVLAAGNEVGDLAMGYYGDFVEVPFLEHGFPAMARLTERLIAAALVARVDGGEPVDWDAWPLDEAAARQAAATSRVICPHSACSSGVPGASWPQAAAPLTPSMSQEKKRSMQAPRLPHARAAGIKIAPTGHCAAQ